MLVFTQFLPAAFAGDVTCASRTGEYASISSDTEGITFAPIYNDTGLTLAMIDETATVWEVADATELEAALNDFQSDDTIRLTADFTYNKGIVIDRKDITFDTNGFTLNVYNYTEPSPGVGLEVKNVGNVYIMGSGQLYIRQIGGNTSYGVKVTGGSTATVTKVEATAFQNDGIFGVYADGTDSSIKVLGDVRVTATSGCGAKTVGSGRITVDGTITAMTYINIGSTYKSISSGVDDPDKPGYLKYCNEPVTGIVWVKAVTVATAPQTFTATPGDTQVALSWTAPASDGGAAISGYEVSGDNGSTWVTASSSTSHTFTGLTNGTEYTFKVRAVNSAGNGAEASAVATPTVPEFAGGDGSEEEPYLIETVDQLKNVRNYLGTEHNDKHFKLNTNLNLDVAPYNSGNGWQPIGTSLNPFSGTFDGDEYIISGLVIKQVGAWNVRVPAGLFGYTGADAVICDLVLEDVDVTGCYYVGSLVGSNSGEITDVKASGNVSGEWDTGGLAGFNSGSISDSCFTGTVTGTDLVEYGEWTGGLVGYNNLGTISNCWTDVTVVSEGDSIGGLVGENYEGTIRESFSSGTITSYDYTGGLVGSNNDEIISCYSTCTVIGDEYVGGLVGGNSGPIANSFAVGVVNGVYAVGGLAGSNTGTTVTSCYWDTETSGQITSACGTSKSTAQLKEQATYEGWDFDGVWGINGSDNDGYPFLRWQVSEDAPTAPSAPQDLTVTPGDTQVALSWTAPASDGGSAITYYQVSKDNGVNWTDVELNTSYTFTGLSNGTEYSFKVRAVNSSGNGAEASATATPEPVPPSTHTVNFNSDSSLYASKTVTSGSALGANWPNNPSKSGYSFDGWFTGLNGAGTMFSSSTIIDADVALYAKWTYIGSSSGSGRGGTPSVPAYQAKVYTGSGTERTSLVTVNHNTGNASLEDDPWAGRPQGRTIVTIPSVPGTSNYSISTSVANLSTTDVHGMLTINTDAGSITVPSNMLTGIEDAEGNKAQITIGKGDKSNLSEEVKDTIGDRPLVQLTLSIDGKPINWNNPEAPVTVSIPYTPTAAELAHPESIVVWYIDGSGNTVPVSNGQYDPETGTVTFTTTHFSYYAVGYHQVNFKDVVSDAWYAKAVSFIAAREITTGTGSSNFSPGAKLTRGQFIVMLMKAYDIAPDLNPQDNFADAGSAYYTSYLAAAKRLGISAGVGDNKFAPEKEITRQEMFTMLYNVLKAIGQLPQNDSGKVLSEFSDAEQVDAWAKDALNLLVRAGIISGSDGKLSPLNTTTRSEMAQVLYNLLGK
jgi:uncharacterized repeat protein (TIGR02543 family)